MFEYGKYLRSLSYKILSITIIYEIYRKLFYCILLWSCPYAMNAFNIGKKICSRELEYNKLLYENGFVVPRSDVSIAALIYIRK